MTHKPDLIQLSDLKVICAFIAFKAPRTLSRPYFLLRADVFEESIPAYPTEIKPKLRAGIIKNIAHQGWQLCEGWEVAIEERMDKCPNLT